MVKISILLAAHNEEKYISEAIESVLNQTFEDWELIIINDRSKDKTKAISKDYVKKDSRIKLINLEENSGWKSGALNKGIEIAEGEYICILDGDDVYLKDKLEFQVNFMGENSDIGMIFGKAKFFGEEEKESHLLKSEGIDLKEKLKEKLKENLSNLRVGNFFGIEGSIPSCSVMIRKKCLEGLKFDENLERTQDYDMWFQLIGKGYKLKGVNKIFYKYRIHSGQGIRNRDKMDKARDIILKKLKSGEYFKS